MKKIILITAAFPYYPGEQFLETEVKFYTDTTIDFTIMPLEKSNEVRDIPNNIKIDNFLTGKRELLTKNKKLYFLLKSCLSKVFYKEVFSKKGLNLNKKSFYSSVYMYQFYLETLDTYIGSLDNIEDTLFYTYWHTELTYALQTLRKKYNFKLISRIHGMDIYQERRKFEYMPLKSLFTENIDKVYTITDSATKYMIDTYGFSKTLLELSRLGVENKNIISDVSDENFLSIVSCSFISEVKRVDKIIDALKILSYINPKLCIEWVHIGDGVLMEHIINYAKSELGKINSVKTNFIGYLDNQKIYEFYHNNKVDVFINVSESEGVPVSIMEALSCYIPIIAPNVGGISDMIENKYNGILLNENPTPLDIANSLSNINFFKDKNVRENAYKIFYTKYNAENNYVDFISKWKEL